MPMFDSGDGDLKSIDMITFSKGSPPTISMSVGGHDVYFDREMQAQIIKILEEGTGHKFRVIYREHDCIVWGRVVEK